MPSLSFFFLLWAPFSQEIRENMLIYHKLQDRVP